MPINQSAPELEVHPCAELFPVLEGEEFAALVGDIKVNGLRSPIILCEGKILDGRNRYVACRQANVPVRTEDYQGSDPLGFVVSANLHRRHVSESQRAMVAAKLATLPRGSNQYAQICAPSHKQAADLVGVSRRTVQHAARVHSKGLPELARSVERGDVAVSLAAKVADLPEDEQRKLVTAGPQTLRTLVKSSEQSKQTTEVRRNSRRRRILLAASCMA